MIPILILAAGQSTRMGGRDKLLEDVGGVPLLYRQVQRASETGHPVFVALPMDAKARIKAIEGLDATIITVPDAAEGMSGTLRGAVPQLPQADAFMVTLGDLVALETSDMAAVLAARATHPDHLVWRGATADGKPGHPIIFDDALRSGFKNLKGDDGAAGIIAPVRDRTHLVRLPGHRARFDLDTPQDWDRWRAANP